DAIDKARAMGNFLAGKNQSPPLTSRSRTADDEVGPGGKTFQARIKDPDVDRLLAIAHIQGWSESQLVRRGLKLFIEEASRDITHLLEKLDAEYHTARRALKENLSPKPRVERQPADQDTAPSVTTIGMPSDAIKVGAEQRSVPDLGREVSATGDHSGIKPRTGGVTDARGR
ncbi:hypothetical protein, partial [Mycobacterium pseudoshottsii]